MMLMSNLPRVIAETSTLERVLDVGGSSIALNTATHILDLIAPADEPPKLAPDLAARQSVTFINHDICRKPWPFTDKYFDYCFC